MEVTGYPRDLFHIKDEVNFILSNSMPRKLGLIVLFQVDLALHAQFLKPLPDFSFEFIHS